MSLLNDERGQFTSAIFFIMAFMVLLFIFSVGITILQSQATQYYGASEGVLEDALVVSDSFHDPEVKATFQDALQGTKDAQQSNIEIISAWAVAGALLLVIITAAIIFLQGRQAVQAGRLA